MADFGVFVAGEEIDGVGVTYVYVSTYVGNIRMTPEEAAELSINLAAAARFHEEQEEYERQEET